MNKQNTQKAQSLVEFALMLPILLTMMFFILDLGRAVYYYSAVQNSAREGARYGIIEPFDWTGVEARARQTASGLDQSNLQVNTSLPTTDTIQVVVRYRFQPLTPVLPGVFGITQIPLNSQATMLVEN